MSAARRIGLLSAMCAAAIMFSYAEALVPVPFVPIPAFKIGFANIVILLVLDLFGAKAAFMTAAVRCAVMSLLFGSLMSGVFSIFGTIAAVVMMTILKHTKIFGLYGVSVAGAAAHNCGQVVAGCIFYSTAVFAYLPYLMICSLVSGVLIALVTDLVRPALKKAIDGGKSNG